MRGTLRHPSLQCRHQGPSLLWFPADSQPSAVGVASKGLLSPVSHSLPPSVPSGHDWRYWFTWFFLPSSLQFQWTRKLKKAIFLATLTSSKTVSKLHTLTCYPVWTIFAPDGSLVSLAPVPIKNEWEWHRLDPNVIPSCTEGDQPHTLCPVSALRQYVYATAQAPLAYLFMWPTSLTCCSKQNSAKIICQVTDLVDSSQQPAPWDVQEFGVSLDYLSLFQGSYEVHELKQILLFSPLARHVVHYDGVPSSVILFCPLSLSLLCPMLHMF